MIVGVCVYFGKVVDEDVMYKIEYVIMDDKEWVDEQDVDQFDQVFFYIGGDYFGECDCVDDDVFELVQEDQWCCVLVEG